MVGDAVAEDAAKADTGRIDARFARFESRMYRALWMQAGVIVAAVVALVKLLPRAAVRQAPPTAVGVFLERQARCARLS